MALVDAERVEQPDHVAEQVLQRVTIATLCAVGWRARSGGGLAGVQAMGTP